MSQEGGGKQQNTAYGVFVQACWAQHKRQYSDEQIHKEIEEFNKQCSVWWYNLSDQERDRFQEMANRSNQTEALQAEPIKTQNNTYARNVVVQQGNTVNSNYAQNMNHQMRGGHMGGMNMNNSGKPSKPIKDPNAPKKPLSAYFLFTNDERQKIKSEFPNMGITDIAKETGRRWANIPSDSREHYESRYQESRNQYDQDMTTYNQNNHHPSSTGNSRPQKKVKDPNAPKQPLSAYFLYQNQERDKIKQANPNFSICEIAKELGKRWGEMPQEVKQHYTQKAEEERHRYDQDMAVYRGGGMKSIEKPPFMERQGIELPLV